MFECINCECDFDAERRRGYCDACLAALNERREYIASCQRPAPGVFVDGKFVGKRLRPSSITDPVSGRQLCGLCGSEDVQHGYGLGTGYGCGVYLFCEECYAFMDFSEDAE